MSQSPTSSRESDRRDSYLKGWQALNTMLLEGRSFSGRERHCCFLNTGGRRFADVSAVAGLDLIDDGRAVAIMDWDHDGDLDFWLSNRTGPSLRFLRNDTATGHHFLAVKLVGRSCNRDAIGARVELHLGDGQQRIKTVRAGEGFLTQSSKWLHFGLADFKSIERLLIHWPGGETETLTGLQVDRRYRIEQGTGEARLGTPVRRRVVLEESEPKVPPSAGSARVVLANRVPFAKVSYRSFAGDLVSLEAMPQRPLLINLWATWCEPCITELSEFAHRRRELERHGLSVLTLNVDGLDPGQSTDSQDPSALLEEIFTRSQAGAWERAPFHGGIATVELVGELEQLQRLFLNKIEQLPIPTSFLIDEQDRLAVFYKGTVGVDQILADLRLLDAEPAELRAAAVPFPGRWSVRLSSASPRAVAINEVVRAFFYKPQNIAVITVGLAALVAVAIRRRNRKKRERLQAG